MDLIIQPPLGSCFTQITSIYSSLQALILLVAMIGAITLTLRKREGVKRHDYKNKIAAQVRNLLKWCLCQLVKVWENNMLEISLAHYLAVGAILCSLWRFGIFINRKNVITILMSIELILLSVNVNLVAFSAYAGDLAGQIFSLFILTVAAAEAAIGLAILVIFFRNRGSIAVEDVNVMKG